jgi:hypothetical protein
VNSRGKEVPHGVRLYSIASSRYGDSFDGMTTTLCVRRATYWDPEMGKDDPAKKGICSNFLCDAEPGTEVVMTGERGNCRRCCLCCLRAVSLARLASDVVCFLFGKCVHAGEPCVRNVQAD